MQDLVLIDPGLIGLIKGSFGENGLPVPFVQEIFLIECHAAGTSYLDLKNLEPELQTGELLILRREPENEHDSLAILLLTQKGEKLGYIPREKNEILARLMDAGKIIFGKIENKAWYGKWLKMMIKIYLREI
jgi:hypothetical protein